jgi:hypothetical protein
MGTAMNFWVSKESRFNSQYGKEIFLLLHNVQTGSGITQFLCCGYYGLYSWSKSSCREVYDPTSSSIGVKNFTAVTPNSISVDGPALKHWGNSISYISIK